MFVFFYFACIYICMYVAGSSVGSKTGRGNVGIHGFLKQLRAVLTIRNIENDFLYILCVWVRGWGGRSNSGLSRNCAQL